MTTPAPVLALPLPRWHTLRVGQDGWGEFVREVYRWDDAELFARREGHGAAGQVLWDDLAWRPWQAAELARKVHAWSDILELLQRVIAFRWMQDQARGSRKDAETQRTEAVGPTSDLRPLTSMAAGEGRVL